MIKSNIIALILFPIVTISCVESNIIGKFDKIKIGNSNSIAGHEKNRVQGSHCNWFEMAKLDKAARNLLSKSPGAYGISDVKIVYVQKPIYYSLNCIVISGVPVSDK